MSTMERILRLMAERKASDIYLSAHSPALIRINGNCMPINAQVLPPERVFTAPGGHGWKPWKAIWEMFLKTGALNRGPAAAAPPG